MPILEHETQLAVPQCDAGRSTIAELNRSGRRHDGTEFPNTAVVRRRLRRVRRISTNRSMSSSRSEGSRSDSTLMPVASTLARMSLQGRQQYRAGQISWGLGSRFLTRAISTGSFLLAGVLPAISGQMASPQRVDRPSNRLEIMMGRSLAICLHPVAAWLSRSQRKRLVLVGGYVGAGYVAVLIALLLLSA
jgi:hypothetical protein